MMIDENKTTGTISIRITDQYGVITQEVHNHNAIVSNGKNFIASRTALTTESRTINAIALGSSVSGLANSATLTLGSYSSITGRSSVTPSATNNSATYIATFGSSTSSNPVSVTEAALLIGVSSDTTSITALASVTPASSTLFAYSSFSLITKNQADTLTFTWTVVNN